jgi:hypothetical protein
MTQATAMKTDALTEFERLERIWQEAEAQAKELGRKQFDARKRLHGHLDEPGLLYERSHRMEREPDEYYPDGSPRREDSAAGRLQAEIDKVPDPAALAQQVEHTRRLERRANEDVDAFIAENFATLVKARRPSAESAAAHVKVKAEELAEALRAYIAQHGGAVRLTVPVVGIDGRAVPGIDEAAAYLRMAEEIDLPAPLPEISR